ncbi:MAG: hypothetical protein K2X81_15070 [Candidatus Obscuribacterales bacterium]|nr:hypothetical protein [Candidatus Obscuribacterales bacterium]
MKSRALVLVLGVCLLQTLATVEPAVAGHRHAARREAAKAAESRAEARQDRREGHGFRAMLHQHHANHEQRRANRHSY